MNIQNRLRQSPEFLAAANQHRAEAHYAVLELNFRTRGLYLGEPEHDRLVVDINAAVAALTVGKWRLGRALDDLGGLSRPSWSDADFKAAGQAFDDAMRIADAAMAGGRANSLLETYAATPLEGTELLAVQGIPIVPSVSPIVILTGSSRQMGAQYMNQVLDIFGSFVFSGFADRNLSGDRIDIINRWARELEIHAPDTLDYAVGMSEAARARGLNLSQHEALSMWTGMDAPSRSYNGFNSLAYFGTPDETPELCSGACAWGDATVDGELYLSATTDHDCTFQATIVAYPDEGNAFIYTPFSVNGLCTFVCDTWFAGHPGINDKGLAYVHHGAGCEGSPINDHWGYGVRRGASTFHVLRHRSNAREAMECELAMPMGDGASILGSVGGFYADKDFGYVIESREPRHGPIIRHHTYDAAGKPLNVLYANNNNIDPRSGTHFAPPKGGYEYELEAGWFTMEEPAPGARMSDVSRQKMAKSSEGRNRYFFERLTGALGEIDLQEMVSIYQSGPSYPDLPWSEIEVRLRGGERFPSSSVAHRRNAFTAAATPRNDGTGLYKGCVGPATHRSVAPQRESHGYIYYDENNEMWEISLPEQVAKIDRTAMARAATRLEVARDHVASVGDADKQAVLNDMLGQAAKLLGSVVEGDDEGARARRLRQITNVQVRAAQAISAATSYQTRGS